MTRLARLENSPERMDGPGLDPVVLGRTLRHLESVNRWLGGHAAVLHAMEPLMRRGCPITVLDVGCGGGDGPRAMTDFALRRHVPHRIVGVERHGQTIRIAADRSRDSGVSLVRADGLDLPFGDASFDIVTMSLTLHHFDGESRIAVLREMARVARQRVVVNDLERCWANYAGARLLAATLWRRDSLARYDGPVSVLRAFTAAELRDDMMQAGLAGVSVERRFFYRLIASGSPRARPAAEATL